MKWALILLFGSGWSASGQGHPPEPAGQPAVPPRVWAAAATNRSDSAAHRYWLLTNYTRWVNVYPGNPYSYVPTNMVAFREYMLEFLLKLANEVNQKWELGLPQPITADHLNGLGVLPLTNDVNAGTAVFGRFGFRFSESHFAAYADYEYWMNAYEGKREKFLQRAKEKDLLNKKTAKAVAIKALYALGYNEANLHLAPPTISQEPGPEPGRGFPYYEVTWRPRKKPYPSWRKPVVIGVSGHTGKICFYENTSEHVPRTPLPTNYWKMLGMEPPAPNTNHVGREGVKGVK